VPKSELETQFCKTEGGAGSKCSPDAPSDENREECCDKIDTCKHYACKQETHVLKEGYESIPCEAATCGDNDLTTCCDERESCGNYDCPSGWKKKDDVDELYCQNATCTRDGSVTIDAEICCDQVATTTEASTTTVDATDESDTEKESTTTTVAQASSGKTVTTKLTKDADKGDKSLSVKSTKGMKVGQRIVIAKGTNDEEENTIKAFGSLMMKSPLMYSHKAGTKVSTVPEGDENEEEEGGARPTAAPQAALLAVSILAPLWLLASSY